MEKTDILCTGALGPEGERKPVFDTSSEVSKTAERAGELY